MINFSARRILLNVLTAASVFIYGAAVLSLHQDQSIPFYVEEDGPLPAAISHHLYGASLGLADTGLLHYFWNNKSGLSAAQAVDQALQGKMPRSQTLTAIPDGIGVGAIVTTELSFLIFGPHASSLARFFILLIGLSSLCFMLRYRDDRTSAVPIVVLSFTLLLITPLTAPENAAQAPIGGMRSYIMIGILPALHWCFEFIGSQDQTGPSAAIRRTLLSVQIAILGLSIWVRGSSIYMLIPICTVAIVALYKYRNSKMERRKLLIWLVTPLAILTIVFGVVPRLAFPAYAKGGRLMPVVWHRAFIGLGIHPSWPFAGLREKYDCPEISEGIVPSIVDRNAHCAWLGYARKHGMSSEVAGPKLYDSDYEHGLRAVFFDTLLSYPREALETFLYYKPKRIFEQTALMMSPDRFHAILRVGGLVILQILLVVVFIGGQFSLTPVRDAIRRISVLSFFVVPALIPQLLAWTLPATGIDIFAYMWSFSIILCWMIVAYAFRLIGVNATFLRFR